ncbi:hypothetical protein GSU68_01420 [Rathayibacter sp. VKM Ac-2759]|uniref:hypothetical protein n=1 Tax=Rathayibacter sp. VKM Ac-2759 TaxID=2609252 RepID=UPI001317FFB2|nr:hypothetical protein [Rathayibacter sp. VKM Ac-2759]QHC65368.1 hypothetical protein GSU68_01420 [Rathayibacter sp. VKM Ac-2759]
MDDVASVFATVSSACETGATNAAHNTAIAPIPYFVVFDMIPSHINLLWQLACSLAMRLVNSGGLIRLDASLLSRGSKRLLAIS